MAENQTALVEPPTAAPPGSDFAPLLRLIRDRGLLTRRTDHYAAAMGLNLALLAAVWAALALVGNTWWQLVIAVPAAILTARTAFFGHDAGHQQVAGSRRANRVLGLIHGNLLTGMSHGWWTEKHNKHHANPNHVGKTRTWASAHRLDDRPGQRAPRLDALGQPAPGRPVLPDAAAGGHQPQGLRHP